MHKHTLIIFVIYSLFMAACTAEAGSAGEMTRATESPAVEMAQAVTAIEEPASVDEAEQTVETGESPATAEEYDSAVLPLIGPAPAWSNEVWINSETPLPLEDLRGKVVLLEFWTFG